MATEGPGCAGGPELDVVRTAEVFVLRDGLICEPRAWVDPLDEE